MKWLPITDSFPGDACPRCDRGELYVRSSRQTGACFQVRYLRCTNCPVTFKTLTDRRDLNRARKVL